MSTVDCYRLLLLWIAVDGNYGNAVNEMVMQYAVLYGELGVHCLSQCDTGSMKQGKPL